jgi:OOP family OmpA-OmpF porin
MKSLPLAQSFVCCAVSFLIATPVVAQPPGSGYVRDASGSVVRSGFGFCVTTGYFTQSLATEECDPRLAKPAVPVAAPVAPSAPAAAPAASATAPTPAPASIPVVVPAAQNVTYKADSFFDFDQSAVKPEGQAALRNLLSQAKGATIEQIRIEGHTCSTGPEKYNMALSLRRAEAVKAFLVKEGVAADKIVTEGFGESQPAASNNTSEGRSRNRRVEVEFAGSRIAR